MIGVERRLPIASFVSERVADGRFDAARDDPSRSRAQVSVNMLRDAFVDRRIR